MRDVSGVSGAAPVLHEVFDHLHKEFGTSWYAQPPTVTERLIHPLTGKIATAVRAGLVKEKFLSRNMPASESPNDYDENGKVKLSPEYRTWFASTQNELGSEVSLERAEIGTLRVVSPLPGTTYFLDPDLPESDRLPLKSNLRDDLVWESATLECTVDAGGAFARLKEGRHAITLRDPMTGGRAETWIVVKAL